MLPQGRFQAFLRARSEDRHALLQAGVPDRPLRPDRAVAARAPARSPAQLRPTTAAPSPTCVGRVSETAGQPLPADVGRLRPVARGGRRQRRRWVDRATRARQDRRGVGRPTRVPSRPARARASATALAAGRSSPTGRPPTPRPRRGWPTTTRPRTPSAATRLRRPSAPTPLWPSSRRRGGGRRPGRTHLRREADVHHRRLARGSPTPGQPTPTYDELPARPRRRRVAPSTSPRRRTPTPSGCTRSTRLVRRGGRAARRRDRSGRRGCRPSSRRHPARLRAAEAGARPLPTSARAAPARAADEPGRRRASGPGATAELVTVAPALEAAPPRARDRARAGDPAQGDLARPARGPAQRHGGRDRRRARRRRRLPGLRLARPPPSRGGRRRQPRRRRPSAPPARRSTTPKAVLVVLDDQLRQAEAPAHPPADPRRRALGGRRGRWRWPRRRRAHDAAAALAAAHRRPRAPRWRGAARADDELRTAARRCRPAPSRPRVAAGAAPRRARAAARPHRRGARRHRLPHASPSSRKLRQPPARRPRPGLRGARAPGPGRARPGPRRARPRRRRVRSRVRVRRRTPAPRRLDETSARSWPPRSPASTSALRAARAITDDPDAPGGRGPPPARRRRAGRRARRRRDPRARSRTPATTRPRAVTTG